MNDLNHKAMNDKIGIGSLEAERSIMAWKATQNMRVREMKDMAKDIDCQSHSHSKNPVKQELSSVSKGGDDIVFLSILITLIGITIYAAYKLVCLIEKINQL